MDGPIEVEFFYCPSNLASYLSLIRLREAALRTGAALVFRPIVAAWLPKELVEATARLTASSNPPIDAYLRKDQDDWSRFCGIQIGFKCSAPISSGWAQRGAVAAIEARQIAGYVEAMFHARFLEGRNISERAVVVDVAKNCGMSESEFSSALDSGYTESVVRGNLAALVRRGGFGSPTMFLRDDMYFGHERVPLLEMALMRSAEQPFTVPGDHER